jgi:hypothetical protein
MIVPSAVNRQSRSLASTHPHRRVEYVNGMAYYYEY